MLEIGWSTKDGRTVYTARKPAAFHHEQLTNEMKAAVGIKPSLSWNDGELFDAAFVGEVSEAKRMAAKAAVLAHDGTARLAADDAARTAKANSVVEAATLRAALRGKAARGEMMTAAEIQKALSLLL